MGATTGLLLALSFPTLNWAWLSWGALIPLLLVCLRGSSWRMAMASGWLSGGVFFGLSCPWIYHTVRHYGGAPAVVAGLVLGLFVLLMGAYFALFALVGYGLARRGPLIWLALPALWTVVEWLRAFTPFGGFPWDLLGYAGLDHAGFMLAATVAGVFGAGFLIALENSVAAWVIAEVGLDGRPLYRTALIAPLMVWAAVVGFASFPYDPPGILPADRRAVLVQPNTPVDASWTAASFQEYLNQMARLSFSGALTRANFAAAPGKAPNEARGEAPRMPPGMAPPAPVASLSGGGPVLILWPESPAPLDYAAEPELRSTLAMLAREAKADLLVGETTLLDPTAPPGEQEPVNAAQLVTAAGTAGARYDKRHLVPFGEYDPLPAWIQAFAGVGKIVSQVGDFVPGRRVVLFSARGAGNDGAASRPPRFAALICYESIFPELARRETRAGAAWLVNLSDDGWYGHSSARAQGLMMARMRALENRRWLLRDTNDGLTAVVDPYGRVTAELPEGARGALRARYGARQDTTFYTRHGDWLPLLCTILVAALALRLAWDERRGRALSASAQ